MKATVLILALLFYAATALAHMEEAKCPRGYKATYTRITGDDGKWTHRHFLECVVRKEPRPCPRYPFSKRWGPGRCTGG